MKRFLHLIIVLALAGSSALGQSSMARMRGVISDPGGAVIPNVEITAKNQETGVTTRTQTNETGSYAFPALAPGIYSLEASTTGLKTYSRSGIRLETADAIELDIKLEIGNLSESVNVTAEAPLLESTTSSVGQMISSRLMTEMPLNSRRSLPAPVFRALARPGQVFASFLVGWATPSP